jgi:hypothetical protein
VSYSPRPEWLVAEVDRDRVLSEPERVQVLAASRRWCDLAVAGTFRVGEPLYTAMRTFVAGMRDEYDIAYRSPRPVAAKPVDLDSL